MVKIFIKLMDGTYVLLLNRESDKCLLFDMYSNPTCRKKFSEDSHCVPLTATYH